ncbi:hypothetical protein GUITHDRAFT_99413 [Guillardia theta CCMP2712]|uniref:Uncharacterized protein n=1 Tax=Guillardia theta (strain CCMP2712) TaxID=905079 RepID=L1K2T1_GUITC|nr:hypothetical protein GUITHDRAFT_99413 [Guillardia theta CCMP2712]EKX54760.1 hypothetical protein GUITHDRAFT_99413 [Guillardia theta CCMP2712]|eukprot:XP_005841740.1 hypothetical protein GUITHDRAFT_99413 [Guillardia theta CCMP2712]
MLKRREGAFYLTYHQAAFEAARSVSSCLALLAEIKSEKIASLGRLQRMEAGKSCVIRLRHPKRVSGWQVDDADSRPTPTSPILCLTAIQTEAHDQRAISPCRHITIKLDG